MVLKFEHVSKTWAYEKESFFDDFCLEINENESVAILMDVQCGKSTLVKLIAGLTQPNSGEIKIDNASLAKIAPEKKNIAVIYQDFALQNKSVFDNVAFPSILRKKSKEEIVGICNKAFEKFEIENLASKSVKALNRFEKMKVALARAWTRKFDILIVDDIFLKQDSESVLRFVKILMDLSKICIVFSSDIELVSFVGRVIVVDDKKIVFDDTWEKANLFLKKTKLFNRFEVE